MKLLKTTLAVLAFLLISNNTHAKVDPQVLDSADIKNQFNHVIKKSSDYNDYKVIKKATVRTLKSHVFDTIDGLKNHLAAINADLNLEKAKTDSLLLALSSTKAELQKVTEYKDSISVLGIPLNKTTYNAIMWAATLGLLGFAAFSLLLFKRSNNISRKTKTDLEEAKEELEFNRRRAREREEKIVRKLHDEINKYKKRVYQLEKNAQ